jgi:hypothetical protein
VVWYCSGSVFWWCGIALALCSGAVLFFAFNNSILISTIIICIRLRWWRRIKNGNIVDCYCSVRH